MNCLLIDIGSTFIKYSVYDNQTRDLIYNNKVSFPEPKLDDGTRFLVCTNKIQEAILKIFSEVEQYDCKKAFISVQMHGYIMKHADGSISDYVSWRDKSGDITDERWKDVNFDELGTSLKNNLPLVKIACERQGTDFFTLGSYVSWILTGENMTHITDACASGFYCAETGAANQFAGNMRMPKVCTEVRSAGKYHGITIYAPMGDHQISFLGSGANEDKYLINIGTATQISCVHDTDECRGDYEKRPYFLKGKRLSTVSGLMGGDVLFKGGKKEEFFVQVMESIKMLPKKSGVLLGGGGSYLVYDYLKEQLAVEGINCSLIEKNIGLEGMKMIADRTKIKAGVMLSEIAFLNFPIIAKNSGLDFMIIDSEHGAFDYATLSGLIVNSNLMNLKAIVRVGDSSRGNLTKIADMGAKGFLLPMTNCKEDIEEVVKYTKYSPVGKRGISTTRAHTLYNPPALADYMKSANEEMEVYAQIETRQGVENVDAILQVHGVNGVFIGPNDLSDDLGCISDKGPVLECIEKVADAAKRAGKVWGIITADKKLLSFSQEQDVDMISCGSELNMLINGCKNVREMF